MGVNPSPVVFHYKGRPGKKQDVSSRELLAQKATTEKEIASAGFVRAAKKHNGPIALGKSRVLFVSERKEINVD